MSTTSSSSSGGIVFAGLLTIVFIGAYIGYHVVTLIPASEPTVSVVQITESYGFPTAQKLTQKQFWNLVHGRTIYVKQERIIATDQEASLILFGMDTK